MDSFLIKKMNFKNTDNESENIKGTSKNFKRKTKFRNRVKRFGKQINTIKDMKLEVGSMSTNAFSLIEKRYSIRTEILPGLVTYNEPLIGEIEILINTKINRLKSIIKQSLYRWSETISYFELRSGKSIIGMKASSTVTDQVNQTTDYITDRIIYLIVRTSNMDSFSLTMERVGINNITIPNYIYEILHLVNSMKRVHRLHFENQSQIRFKTILGDEIQSYYNDNLKGMLLDEVLYEMSFLQSQMKLGDNKTITDFNELNSPSPNLFNALLIEDNERTEKPTLIEKEIEKLDFIKQKSEPEIKLMVGYSTTQKDVALTLLLGLKFKSTNLPSKAIDYFYYKLDKSYIRGPLVNYFVNEYFNMNDMYKSPEINTPSDETFDINFNDTQIQS